MWDNKTGMKKDAIPAERNLAMSRKITKAITICPNNLISRAYPKDTLRKTQNGIYKVICRDMTRNSRA